MRSRTAIARAMSSADGVSSSEYRMLFREIVYPAGKAADDPLPGKPVEGNVNRLAAADVEEISRNEDRATPVAANCRNDPRINGLW